MTIKNFLKPDAARFAKEDLASNYNKWQEAERKPGEVKIARQFRDHRSFLISQKKLKERELLLKEKQLVYAREFDTTDIKRHEKDDKIKAEIYQLGEDLKQVRAELQKVEEAITRLKIKNPEFKEQIEAKPVDSERSKFNNNWFMKHGKNMLLTGMLIFISGFDGFNMYLSLEKFDHDPTKYQILCSFVFCAVLFTSYNLKKHNTPILWIGFLLFVSVANIPQFLGRDPVFGISNLFNSPSHIIVFVISFFGSVLITVINQWLNTNTKKDIKPHTSIDHEPAESQINDKLQFTQLLKKREVFLLKERLIISKMTDKDKQLENLAQNSEDKEKATIDEKLNAIQQLDEEQIKLQVEIEQMQVQINDLAEDLRESIQEYRQEIEIMQLINNYPATVNYPDINSFTI